ncbi:hypothetical protein SMICM304S_01331 [Streptomyces microflavus]
MRRDRALSVEAGGEAAVAVGGDNVAPVITNPVVNNTLNLHVLREEPTLVSRARNLPPGVPDFTGRVAEIEVIEREVLDGRKGQRSVTAVVTRQARGREDLPRCSSCPSDGDDLRGWGALCRSAWR